MGVEAGIANNKFTSKLRKLCSQTICPLIRRFTGVIGFDDYKQLHFHAEHVQSL